MSALEQSEPVVLVPETSVARLPLDDPAWRAHVERRSDALPFHHPAWSTFLSECYGLDGYVLALLRDGLPAGGIPLLRARRPLGPRRLVGLPYTDYLPILNDGSTDLASSVEHELAASGVARVELRSAVPGLPAKAAGYRHVLPLSGDPQTTYARFSAKRVRQLLRRIDRQATLTVRRGESRADMDTFYALHTATRRRLGVPVQPRRFFRLLWERVLEPGYGWLLLAEAESRAVGGTVLLQGGETVVYKFSAADRAAKQHFPAHALLWHAIQDASDRGFRAFDFGRTDAWNGGLREFKLSWGTDELPLEYAYAGTPLDADSGPGTAGELLGAAIRRSPQWVARGIGELLYRYAA